MAIHSSTIAWKIHGQRSLAGYSPWGRKESDTTERLHFHFLIPQAVTKWSKDQEKVTEKGMFGPHASPFSGRFPRRNVGCLLALASQYKPPTTLPFLGLPSVIIRHHETTEQGSMLASWLNPRLFHAAFTHTGTP